MPTHLSNHFRQQRLVLGLRPGQVARLLGYKSLVGAANKIIQFEETGDIDYRLFKQLAAVLFVDKGTIQCLMKKDRRDLVRQWHQWANQPITPHVVAEVLLGHYMIHDFPEDIMTPEQMETHVAELACELHERMWLVFSRKLTVLFDEGGHKRAVQEAAPGEPTEPYRLLLSGKASSFFTSDGEDVDFRSMRCPQKRGPRARR